MIVPSLACFALTAGQAQMGTYQDPGVPIVTEAVRAIADWILALRGR